MKIAGILLAAGNSRRFGENKLLYCIDGKPMYEYGLEILAGLPLDSLCVVTQYREIEKKARELGILSVYNGEAQKGISSSIILGIEASPQVDAYLFAVADQPWMKKETVEKFLKFYKSSKKGIASVGKGTKLGNPCIFAREYLQELLHLQGDQGGKAVIRAHMEDLAVYQMEDERELEDIDYKI